MPPGDDIQRYLTGAWRLMTGRQDGLALFDLTADGFWNSFSAIVMALPVLLATWVPVANEVAGADAAFPIRLAFVGRLAFIDLAAWILPLALFAALARPLGLADRFVPYVVATNWGSALLIWLTLPVVLFELFWPGGNAATDIVALLIVLTTLVLAWRLTNAALARGPAIASGIFFGSLAVSFVVLFSLQSMLGIPMPS